MIYITQCKCPQDHCIVALAWDDAVAQQEQMEKRLKDAHGPVRPLLGAPWVAPVSEYLKRIAGGFYTVDELPGAHVLSVRRAVHQVIDPNTGHPFPEIPIKEQITRRLHTVDDPGVRPLSQCWAWWSTAFQGRCG